MHLWGGIGVAFEFVEKESILELDTLIPQWHNCLPFSYQASCSIDLPVSLSNASGLQEIDFAYGNFTGTKPTNLGSLKGLARLKVSTNH